MKKVITILLVSVIPFLSIAQKRGNKSNNATSNPTYEFMVIKGVEVNVTERENQLDGAQDSDVGGMSTDVMSEEKLKRMIFPHTRLHLSFSTGGKNKDVAQLMLKANNIHTMAAAVNKAATFGWEFVNANVVSQNNIVTIHYYYMRKKK